MFSEYKKALYTSFCRNYVRVLVSQDRDKGDDISASDSKVLIYNILPLKGYCHGYCKSEVATYGE